MRSITAILCSLLLALSLAIFPIPTHAFPPPLVLQSCQDVNAGTARQVYTVTFGSGGTAGCTHAFTTGDAIFISYNFYNDAPAITVDPTSISNTGATITWHRAISFRDTVFTLMWSGQYYACPSDISAPTGSIAVSVDMGAMYKNTTAIYGVEVTHIQAAGSCLDSATSNSSANCTPGTNNTVVGGTSGMLAQPIEFVYSTGQSFDNLDCSAIVGSITYTAGTAAGSGSFGNFTIPANGQDSEANCIFRGSTNLGACGSFSEYFVTSVTTSKGSYIGYTPGQLSGVGIQVTYIGGPGPNSQRPRFLEY